MKEFVKCSECDFYLLGAAGDPPTPKRVDRCPACGSTDFERTGSAPEC